MKKIFMTGVTGFVGSFLAKRMLEEGCKIYFLSRGKKDISARERVENVLNMVGYVHDDSNPDFEIIEGDVTIENLGIDTDTLSRLGDVDEIWHTAGSINFSEDKRDEIFDVNVNGTINVLKIAEAVNAKKYYFISTAYVQGNSNVVAYGKDAENLPEFNNPYEQSKHRAEKIVENWGKDNPGVEIFVFRPSIVVGDEREGKAFNFSGYYRYMRVFYIIKNYVSSGKLTAKKVMTDKGESIALFMQVPGFTDAEINLITADYMVDTIMSLRDKGEAGVYMVVNPSPPTYSYLLKAGLDILGISNVIPQDVSPDGWETSKEMEEVKEMIFKGMADYLPYISRSFVFNMDDTKKTLGPDYRNHPEFTTELIELLLNFAVNNNFRLRS